MATLCCDNLRIPLGRRGLPTPVSFLASDGEIVIIRGANGSGKTTLLKALAGVVDSLGSIKYSSGEYEYLIDSDDLRSITGVSLEPVFWPGTLVQEILEDQCRLFETSDRNIVQVAQTLGVEHLLDQKCDVLSQGERTRLSIARALVTSPKILVLDEPERGLDSEGIHLVTGVLSKFLGAGGIVVMATHSTDWELLNVNLVNLEEGWR